jgi:hypothetical protein
LGFLLEEVVNPAGKHHYDGSKKSNRDEKWYFDVLILFILMCIFLSLYKFIYKSKCLYGIYRQVYIYTSANMYTYIYGLDNN